MNKFLKIGLISIGVIILFAVTMGQKPAQNYEKDIIREKTTNNEYSDMYQTIIPQPKSEIRGVALKTVDSQIDLESMESGLIEISKQYYDVNKYIYSPGQIFTEKQGYQMLSPAKTEAEVKALQAEDSEYFDLGLNPTPGEDPNNHEPIVTIIEQDYLIENRDGYVTEGVSIAFGIDPTYKSIQEDELIDKEYTEKEMIAIGTEAANKILYYLRSKSEYKNVEVVFAVYKLEEESSLIPGYYIAHGKAGADQAEIKKMTETNTEVYLFPSEEGDKAYPELNNQFEKFKSEIVAYFPNYTGVYGIGTYQNGRLTELEIEIPIEFYSHAEVIAFTQFTADTMQKIFARNIQIIIKIYSSQTPEALITREPTGKPQIFIY